MDRSKVDAPISPEMQIWIEERFRWLGEQFGWYRLRNQQTLLLTTEFFPATIKTPDEIHPIFQKLCVELEVPEQDIELRIYPIDEMPTHLTHLGFSGLYRIENARTVIDLIVYPDDTPSNIIATLAHELGHVRLLGENRISEDETDHEPLTDLCTVFFGTGVINGNSTIHEAHMSNGQLIWWRAGKRGYLEMPDFAYALALYAAERGEDRPSWVPYLRGDLRQFYRQSRKALQLLGLGKISERTGPVGPFNYPEKPSVEVPAGEIDEVEGEDNTNIGKESAVDANQIVYSRDKKAGLILKIGIIICIILFLITLLQRNFPI